MGQHNLNAPYDMLISHKYHHDVHTVCDRVGVVLHCFCFENKKQKKSLYQPSFKQIKHWCLSKISDSKYFSNIVHECEVHHTTFHVHKQNFTKNATKSTTQFSFFSFLIYTTCNVIIIFGRDLSFINYFVCCSRIEKL